MKYIVTWIILKFIPVPCPDLYLDAKTDEFGRVTGSIIAMRGCAGHRIDTISNSKEFLNREDAVMFFERGKKEENKLVIFSSESLANFKLDSLHIK